MPSAAQQAALDHVTTVARTATPGAHARLTHLTPLLLPGITDSSGIMDVAELSAGLLRRGRVAVQFHPDRISADGATVVEGLLARGRYVSQFVTGISAGGLTAYPGGDRDRWEQAMFGGAYQAPGVQPAERPVYGAIDLLRHADGPAPRFGSCHLRLRPEVLARATFTVGDSNLSPTDAGTAHELTAVVAGLLEELSAGRLHLGAPELGPAELVGLLRSTSEPPVLTTRLGRALDEYVEAQVHGLVSLADDVELLVADPSFQGTATGDALRALADRYGFPLRWHPGFVLPVDEVPEAPRGPVVPRLAGLLRERWGVDVVDAASIGVAARDVVLDPGSWSSWGPPAETLQHLKYLWHVLVLAGRSKG